jgi:hypothetical protein
MKHFLAVLLKQVLMHIFDHELQENAITRNFPCVKSKSTFHQQNKEQTCMKQTWYTWEITIEYVDSRNMYSDPLYIVRRMNRVCGIRFQEYNELPFHHALKAETIF